jgi:multiple sugar transport system ATP-binding protein
LQIGQALTLGIRPEDLQLAPVSPEGSAAGAVLRRQISLIERLGEQTYLHVGRADEPMLLKVPGNSPCEVDEPIDLVIPGACCHLFREDGRALPRLGRFSTPIHKLNH